MKQKELTAKDFLRRMTNQLDFVARKNVGIRGKQIDFLVKVQKLTIWMNAYSYAPESSHLGFLKTNAELIRSLIPSKQKNTIEQFNQLINQQ